MEAAITTSSPPKVRIHKGRGRQPWRVTLVAGNGEALVQSEGYVSKWNAKRAARRMFPGLTVELWR